jgi:RNA recognition motif-containing protein
MGRKLFVGNLPFQTTEDELHDLFSQVDAVETVTVMRDQMTGRARGFAFVEMSSDEGAQKAIDQLNNTQLGGRTLAINEHARKRRGAAGSAKAGGERRGGGYGGGGGGNRRREPRW